MIFKKNTNDWAPTPAKKPMQSARPTQPQRREPEVSRPLTANNTYNAPVSPHATAQARRTPQQMPNPASARQEQMRKLTVGRDISLNGEIATCDHLLVEGTVKATIKGGKILEIAETGTFTGVVDIEQADIAGTFDGILFVRGKLTIRSTAIVTGEIHSTRLQVDTGATINAELRSLQPIAQQEEPQQQPQQPVVQNVSNVHMQSQMIQDDEQARLFNFTAINDEPGFLKASA